jgi:hypothetical protein
LTFATDTTVPVDTVVTRIEFEHLDSASGGGEQ